MIKTVDGVVLECQAGSAQTVTSVSGASVGSNGSVSSYNDVYVDTDNWNDVYLKTDEGEVSVRLPDNVKLRKGHSVSLVYESGDVKYVVNHNLRTRSFIPEGGSMYYSSKEYNKGFLYGVLGFSMYGVLTVHLWLAIISAIGFVYFFSISGITNDRLNHAWLFFALMVGASLLAKRYYKPKVSNELPEFIKEVILKYQVGPSVKRTWFGFVMLFAVFTVFSYDYSGNPDKLLGMFYLGMWVRHFILALSEASLAYSSGILNFIDEHKAELDNEADKACTQYALSKAPSDADLDAVERDENKRIKKEMLSPLFQ